MSGTEPSIVHPACLTQEELLAQCTMTRGRSGGPGGQHRNKVETAVTFVHNPTGISASASERRSVRENRPVALKRLRLKLATEYRSPVPAGEIRSELWLERCRKGKIACNPRHWDYPALLSEALDVIAACDYDPKKAGLRLSCTMSQLCRLIQNHPPAWASLNQARQDRGLRVLR